MSGRSLAGLNVVAGDRGAEHVDVEHVADAELSQAADQPAPAQPEPRPGAEQRQRPGRLGPHRRTSVNLHRTLTLRYPYLYNPLDL